MVSATATTKPEAGWRAFARSRITRIIFIWNFVGLAVLIVGVLLLSEMRAGLTDAEYRNLRTQGELITNLLIETGTVQGDPDPYINGDAVRDVMQRLLPPIAEGYGAATLAEATVGVTRKRGGKTVGYLNAYCSGGRLQVDGTLSFSDGDFFPTTLTSPCHSPG